MKGRILALVYSIFLVGTENYVIAANDITLKQVMECSEEELQQLVQENPEQLQKLIQIEQPEQFKKLSQEETLKLMWIQNALYEAGKLDQSTVKSIDTLRKANVEAFSFASSQLKTVCIPEGIEEIGDNAIAGTFGKEIEEITLPRSLKTISEGAFTGCKNIHKVICHERLLEQVMAALNYDERIEFASYE